MVTIYRVDVRKLKLYYAGYIQTLVYKKIKRAVVSMRAKRYKFWTCCARRMVDRGLSVTKARSAGITGAHAASLQILFADKYQIYKQSGDITYFRNLRTITKNIHNVVRDYRLLCVSDLCYSHRYKEIKLRSNANLVHKK